MQDWKQIFIKCVSFLICLNNIVVKVDKLISDIVEWNTYVFPVF